MIYTAILSTRDRRAGDTKGEILHQSYESTSEKETREWEAGILIATSGAIYRRELYNAFYPRLNGDNFASAHAAPVRQLMHSRTNLSPVLFRDSEDAAKVIHTRVHDRMLYEDPLLVKFIFARHCPHAIVSIQSLRHRMLNNN